MPRKGRAYYYFQHCVTYYELVAFFIVLQTNSTLCEGVFHSLSRVERNASQPANCAFS
jgi:hypothetical protein